MKKNLHTGLLSLLLFCNITFAQIADDTKTVDGGFRIIDGDSLVVSNSVTARIFNGDAAGLTNLIGNTSGVWQHNGIVNTGTSAVNAVELVMPMGLRNDTTTTFGDHAIALGYGSTSYLGGVSFGAYTVARAGGLVFGQESIAGFYGFSGGTGAIGTNGSFVFADSETMFFDRSDYPDSFNVKAIGGTYFETPTLSVSGNLISESINATDMMVSNSAYVAIGTGSQFFSGTTNENTTYKNVFSRSSDDEHGRLVLFNYIGDATTGGVISPMTFKRTTTGSTFSPGAGAGFLYAIEKNDGIERFVARTAGRRGPDENTGRFDIDVVQNGTLQTVATFLHNGNVGIGTTTPQAKLEVDGDIISSGEIEADAIIATNLMVIPTSSTAPESDASGTVGEIKWHGNYLYICVGENQWRRAQLFDY